ncbi:hypothetical protein N7491_004188 [Penicillium cf. griseofulvum]|uniref:Uncharacterized protein n=1 Tax=Penicillium cf. griseofulvum TaxID=2972120 RepID=A0A9W9T0S4_9EURO|nr:hypothetical protein N7472_001637 [Penicillium cf. griseofulvum]KAJ5441782.1 hypothetical protein N7491_004188 [Penicillium cf. griseofulvum]
MDSSVTWCTQVRELEIGLLRDIQFQCNFNLASSSRSSSKLDQQLREELRNEFATTIDNLQQQIQLLQDAASSSNTPSLKRPRPSLLDLEKLTGLSVKYDI